jgi:hypothetical protein
MVVVGVKMFGWWPMIAFVALPGLDVIVVEG